MSNKKAKELKIKFIDHIPEDVKKVLGYIASFLSVLGLLSLLFDLVVVTNGSITTGISGAIIAFGKTYAEEAGIGLTLLTATPELIISYVFLVMVAVLNIYNLPKLGWIKNIIVNLMLIYCLSTFIKIPVMFGHHALTKAAIETTVWGIVFIVIVAVLLAYSLFLTFIDYKEIYRNKDNTYKGLYIFFITVLFFSLFIGILRLYSGDLSRIYTGGKFILGEENASAFLSLSTLNPNELIEAIYCAAIALMFIGLKVNNKPNKNLQSLISFLTIFIGYFMLYIHEDAFADTTTTGLVSLTPYGLFTVIVSILFMTLTLIKNINSIESKEERIKRLLVGLLLFTIFTAFYNVLSGQTVMNGEVRSKSSFAGTTIIAGKAVYSSYPVNGIYLIIAYALLVISLVILLFKFRTKIKYLITSILLVCASIMYVFIKINGIEAIKTSSYYQCVFTTNGMIGLITLIGATIVSLYITAVTPNKKLSI